MQINKMSSHPPSKKPIEEFILGAEQKKKDNNYSKQKSEIIHPWQKVSVREDVQKVFTVKLQEEYMLKIKFVSEYTNKSQQKIIREIICKEIDKIVEQLI